VIISEKVSVTATTLSIVTRPTVSASVEVDNASNSNVHHPEKALVLLLELFLVEYLHGEYALLIYAPVRMSVSAAAVAQCASNIHIKAFVPVGIERLLDHTRRPRLLAADRGDREGVWESYMPVSVCAASSSSLASITTY
jgi:hypothetical protein